MIQSFIVDGNVNAESMIFPDCLLKGLQNGKDGLMENKNCGTIPVYCVYKEEYLSKCWQKLCNTPQLLIKCNFKNSFCVVAFYNITSCIPRDL